MNALKSNKNIYLISGLGADETIFQRLNFGALNPVTDKLFLKWAINAIVNWKNKELIPQLIHIHGDSDRILPNKNKIDFIIPNGGHLMVFNQSDLINPLISKQLKKYLF